MTMVIQVDACGEETENNRALSALSLLLLLLFFIIIIVYYINTNKNTQKQL